MAQSVPPGDIQTQPGTKIVFNAPYDDKHTYHIKVINSSARRIGYGIKTTNMKRLGVDVELCGVHHVEFSTQRKLCFLLFPAMLSPSDKRIPTTTVSLLSGPTPRMELPSNSVVNGSRETVWFVARTFQSSTIHRMCELGF